MAITKHEPDKGNYHLEISGSERLEGDFLMAYDITPEIQAMAERHGFSTRPVVMKNTHHAEMVELLVGRGSGWV